MAIPEDEDGAGHYNGRLPEAVAAAYTNASAEHHPNAPFV
jgi:hypothetical protein